MMSCRRYRQQPRQQCTFTIQRRYYYAICRYASLLRYAATGVTIFAAIAMPIDAAARLFSPYADFIDYFRQIRHHDMFFAMSLDTRFC